LLWIAANPPHDTTFPSRAWAELLDLDDPGHRGARRVQEAVAWLETNRFLRSEKIPGLPSRLYLLNEAGTGQPYEHPAKSKQPYVTLPTSFWTKGWIAVLTGSAVAILLI